MYFEVASIIEVDEIEKHYTINHIEYDDARRVYCIEAY